MPRPSLHFTPPKGWMNDPNGLVYFGGEWHLFYQYTPEKSVPGQMHWGHAVSTDLFNWRHLPIAISPDELGDIWSGGAAVCEDQIVACFTHHTVDRQVQSLAWSKDGITFEKDPTNPVLISDRKDFRDPKIFRHGDGWRMIIAAGPSAQIYESPDLRQWSLLSEIPAPEPGWIWECPDLFELAGTWVLIGSFVIPGRPHETYYWLGHFDGTTFEPKAGPHRLSFGPDDYAAVTWSDAPDGRRILIGWMSRWDYGAQTPASEGFRGAMTVPRELSVRDGKFAQVLAREIDGYHDESVQYSDLIGGTMVPLSVHVFHLHIDFEPTGLHPYGIRLFTGPDEYVVIGMDPQAPKMFICRGQSGHWDLHPRFADRYSTPLNPTFEPGFSILVDECSVEVFAQGGQIYGAALTFPTGEDWLIETFGATTESLKISSLRPHLK